MMVKKVFISQPMNGKSDDEILTIKSEASKLIDKYFNILGYKAEIVSTFFTEADKPDGIPENANRLWYLGRAIQMLGQCEYCFFCDGWENAKGCVIESEVCKKYGILSINKDMINEILNPIRKKI